MNIGSTHCFSPVSSQASQMAKWSLDAMEASTPKAQATISDGFMRSVEANGTESQKVFARTARSATTWSPQCQASLQKLAMEMLSCSQMGSLGLALAQFGGEAYKLMTTSPEPEHNQQQIDKANSAALQILGRIEEHASGSHTPQLARLGREVVANINRSEEQDPGQTAYISNIFAGLAKEESHPSISKKAAMVNFGLMVAIHGTGGRSDRELATQPTLTILEDCTPSSEVAMRAAEARRGGVEAQIGALLSFSQEFAPPSTPQETSD